MQSAFQSLFNLVKYSMSNPLEDCLTEIIAPIFSEGEILSSFLYKFTGKHFEAISNIRVSTQKTYSKIFDHDRDSRPDLVISFESKCVKQLIFIENKLGSEEGAFQLKRYFDHLKYHAKRGYQTSLFYITKKYDPKEKSYYSNEGVRFNQLQWFQVYDWLKTLEDNLYVNEVCKYMEVNGLNRSRKFTPGDINALQNLKKIQSMLDETLDGKLKEVFERLFGKPMQWSNRANQLRNFNRYVLISDQSDWKFIGCGFWFTEEDYPEISVFLEVTSNCKSKEEVIQAINTFLDENEEWILEGPEDDKDSFIVYRDISILTFLSEADHIDSIQEYIIKELSKLHTLKSRFSELKWESRG
ncbi:PD-(D/E)XK nuclease family protein [Peribacillus sp. B-H-3]|uniref:PD-(D/E)XK nuclease family protein n=1 Tax=Peribacillus sp. B-H-3 TaxID=3400420 RepID=UPI003B01D7CC